MTGAPVVVNFTVIGQKLSLCCFVVHLLVPHLEIRHGLLSEHFSHLFEQHPSETRLKDSPPQDGAVSQNRLSFSDTAHNER